MDNNLKSPLLEKKNNNYVDNPLESSNFFQKLLFLWVLPILKVEMIKKNKKMNYLLRKEIKNI